MRLNSIFHHKLIRTRFGIVIRQGDIFRRGDYLLRAIIFRDGDTPDKGTCPLVVVSSASSEFSASTLVSNISSSDLFLHYSISFSKSFFQFFNCNFYFSGTRPTLIVSTKATTTRTNEFLAMVFSRQNMNI